MVQIDNDNLTTTVPDDDVIIKSVYMELRKTIKGKKITNNLIPILMKIILIVQKSVIGKNKGNYKKELVLKVLSLFIKKDMTCFNKNDRMTCDLFLQLTAPSLIDTSIGISRGYIELGHSINNDIHVERTPCCCIFSYKKN